MYWFATQTRAKRDIEVAAPVGVKKLNARNHKKKNGDVMAETILAGKQVEELPAGETARVLRLVLAVITRLAKNFFMGNCPGDAGDRYRQY